MKLVIFGLTASSSWGNGHATLWRGLCQALDRAGHRVVFFERDVPYYAAHRDLTAPEGWELVIYPSWEQIRDRAARELAGADIAIITSYCADALEAAPLAHRSDACRVFYDMDTPVTLARLAAGEPVEYIGADGLGAFDLVLSYTGGAVLDQLAGRLGARRVAPLYGSVDPQVYRPLAAGARAGVISYLGTYAADRQRVIERLLFEPARRLPDRSFVLGGSMYPDELAWPANLERRDHVPPPEHAAFYGGSAITLNATREPMARTGYCPSGRLFEAAACGTPVLSDRWPGLECFFEPGREILVAESSDQAVEILSRPAAELDRIGRAARRRVLAEHTAEARAATLIALVANTNRSEAAHVGNHPGRGNR